MISFDRKSLLEYIIQPIFQEFLFYFRFLYDLSLIPDYAERIFCFIFQQAFQESIAVIESKMTNLRMTCRVGILHTHVHTNRKYMIKKKWIPFLLYQEF